MDLGNGSWGVVSGYVDIVGDDSVCVCTDDFPEGSRAFRTRMGLEPD